MPAKASTDEPRTGDFDDEESGLYPAVGKDGDYLPERWEDIVAKYGGEVDTMESPWKLVDKRDLLGVPFIIADFRFLTGDYGEDCVAVRAMTQDNVRIVFTDGSTGIRTQLKHYQQVKHRNGGIVCPNGLRVSEYEYTDPEGKTKPAKTYYVA